MMKMERLTDDNIVYYEVVKIVLIHETSIPPPRKGFFKIRTQAPIEIQINFNFIHCVVPENVHTHHKDGHWKFREGGGSQKSNF